MNHLGLAAHAYDAKVSEQMNRNPRPELILIVIVITWLFVVTLAYYIVHKPFTTENALATWAYVDLALAFCAFAAFYAVMILSGALIAGADLIAVDATAARLMGFNPAPFAHLGFTAWAGVGAIDESRIDLVGEPLARLQREYEKPPRLS